jgi:predicted nucleic acid-binding Zn finger protein
MKMLTFRTKSKSSDKVYKTLVSENGRVSSCNCPGWIYSLRFHDSRTCRHVVAARAKVRAAR